MYPLKHNILFIHHHKTGHKLSRDIAQLITNALGNKNDIIYNPIKKRHYTVNEGLVQFQDIAYNQKDYALYIQASPYNINSTKNLKVVHFVRDPYNMCISSFLYHKQSPTPEKWVHIVDPLKHNRFILSYMARYLNLEYSLISDLYKLGKEFYNSNLTFYENIRNQPIDRALKLETIRFTISSDFNAGADILRMPYLSKIIKSKNIDLLQVSLDHLNSDDLQKQKTMNKLIKFLELEFQINSQNLTNDLSKRQEKIKKEGNHVTKHLVSNEEKKIMSNILGSDPQISKLLNFVRIQLQID